MTRKEMIGMMGRSVSHSAIFVGSLFLLVFHFFNQSFLFFFTTLDLDKIHRRSLLYEIT